MPGVEAHSWKRSDMRPTQAGKLLREAEMNVGTALVPGTDRLSPWQYRAYRLQYAEFRSRRSASFPPRKPPMGNKGKGIAALVAAGVLYTASKAAEAPAAAPPPADRNFLQSATGVAGPKKDMTLRLVDEMRGDEGALKVVARRAYRHAYGASLQDGDYCGTLEQIFFDRSLRPGTSYRQDAVANLDLSKSEAPDGLVRVEETNKYTLVANLNNVPGRTFNHPLRMSSRFPIDKNAVVEALRQCALEITVGEKVVATLSDLPPDLSPQHLSGGLVVGNGVTVGYDGTHLDIKVAKEIPITSPETPIHIYERSFIEVGDTLYTLRYSQAAHRMSFHMGVERQYFTLDAVSVGPNSYWIGDDAKGYAKQQGWPEPGKRHFVDLRVDRWVVPGLVLAVHSRVN